MSADGPRTCAWPVDHLNTGLVSSLRLASSKGSYISLSWSKQATMSGLPRPMPPFQPKQPLSPQQQMYRQAQRSKEQPAGPVREKGKAFTLTTDQADASGEVVTGIILVHSVPAYALFDSGATHCFISSKFIRKHNISCDIVHRGWTISTGNGTVSCNKVCSQCPVVIGCLLYTSPSPRDS